MYKKKITHNNKEYKLMLVTKDYVYYGISSESDENNNTLMIRKADNTIISDNYFAHECLFGFLESLYEGEYTEKDYSYISDECKDYINSLE